MKRFSKAISILFMCVFLCTGCQMKLKSMSQNDIIIAADNYYSLLSEIADTYNCTINSVLCQDNFNYENFIQDDYNYLAVAYTGCVKYYLINICSDQNIMVFFCNSQTDKIGIVNVVYSNDISGTDMEGQELNLDLMADITSLISYCAITKNDYEELFKRPNIQGECEMPWGVVVKYKALRSFDFLLRETSIEYHMPTDKREYIIFKGMFKEGIQ